MRGRRALDATGGLTTTVGGFTRETSTMMAFRKNFRWVLGVFGVVVGLAACTDIPMAPRLPEDPDENPDVEEPGKPKPPAEDN